MTFVGMLNSIQAMAYGISKRSRGRFVVNELVNEAWIRSLRYDFSDSPLIMRRARMDMIDYIRQQVGRRYFYLHGKKVKRVKDRLNYLTNADGIAFGVNPGLSNHNPISIFDCEHIDTNLYRLENNELLAKLILVEPTKRQLEAMWLYYFEGKNLKEIAKQWDRAESSVCNSLKRGIRKCQAAIGEMEFVEN